ncbi:hypothetical protein PMAYCL1PPCAC_13051, partial [Pristionchus mayeri]
RRIDEPFSSPRSFHSPYWSTRRSRCSARRRVSTVASPHSAEATVAHVYALEIVGIRFEIVNGRIDDNQLHPRVDAFVALLNRFSLARDRQTRFSNYNVDSFMVGEEEVAELALNVLEDDVFDGGIGEEETVGDVNL